MEQADRYNEGKPRWSLVDFSSLEPLVRVLEYGAKKYDDDNWKKGLPFKEVCESMMRHLIAFMGGEDLDQESHQPHLGHIMANCMFLEYYVTSGLNSKFDDRYENSTYKLVRDEAGAVLEQVFEENNITVETDDDEIIEALKGSDYKKLTAVPELHQLIKATNEQLVRYNRDVEAYSELDMSHVCNLKECKDGQ